MKETGRVRIQNISLIPRRLSLKPEETAAKPPRPSLFPIKGNRKFSKILNEGRIERIEFLSLDSKPSSSSWPDSRGVLANLDYS